MGPEKTIGGALLFIGLAGFGVLAWASRKLMSLGRTLDAGDAVVLSVFVVFASGCLLLGWRLYRTSAGSPGTAAPAAAASDSPPRRVRLSHVCSTAGVVLLMACVLVPAHWYPVVLLFLGLALLAVAHVFTPCEERLEKLRKARASLPQL